MDEAKLKILAVDDDRITLKFLETYLSREKGLEVHVAGDGGEALETIKENNTDILLTDWMMPKMDGLSLCRALRDLESGDHYTYIIILTAKTRREDIVAGLAAGADDYMVKPFNQDELIARVRTGIRIVKGQLQLRRANQELSDALAQIRTLKGLLPICMDCRKVRSDTNYWQDLETFITQATETEFSHGLCPECHQKRLRELEKFKTRR
ncbi:MAG: response regulator [Pseudomonadota bacterium]